MQKLDVVYGHLSRAGAELVGLCKAPDSGTFTRHWANFLSHHNRIFSALAGIQKISKNGPAKGWLGQVFHVRRTDELLAYLHQARHAEDHGLQRIAERVPPLIGFRLVPADGEARLAAFVRPEATKLVPVVNCGKIYKRPSVHLGQPLSFEIRPPQVLAAEAGSPPPNGICLIAGLAHGYCGELFPALEKFGPL